VKNKTIRVGVIGAGGNTRARHIPGLQALPGVEIVAVANRTPQSGQRVAGEFNIPQVARDWRAIIEDDAIDAICIGTWPNLHATLTVAALDAGKHVLCEARMARNAFEARTMFDAARRNPSKIAQIVPAPRTLAFDQTIIEMIGAGHIGELIAVDARIAANSVFPNWDSLPHWRHDRDLSGNNIMSMGIWYETIMRWVGPARTVFALGQQAVRYRKDGEGRRVAMTIPDHVDVLCEMEQGGQMRFNVSTVLGHAPANADIWVFGSEGTLHLHEDRTGNMALYAGQRGHDAMAAVAVDPAKRGGWRVEAEFINAIRGVEPVTHTDFATALRYMEWTDAVTLSIRRGERIALPLMNG
jgi:predicted dehydrogenase